MFHLKCPCYVKTGEDPGQIQGTANFKPDIWTGQIIWNFDEGR